jgi:hypothetical protein
MPLTTSSVGAIIYSGLMTITAVTGRYEAHPGVLRNEISWMDMALEDGGSAAVAFEDGGGAALGGGIGQRVKIPAVALGSGGGRRTFNYGIGISVVKAKGLS